MFKDSQNDCITFFPYIELVYVKSHTLILKFGYSNKFFFIRISVVLLVLVCLVLFIVYAYASTFCYILFTIPHCRFDDTFHHHLFICKSKIFILQYFAWIKGMDL